MTASLIFHQYGSPSALHFSAVASLSSAAANTLSITMVPPTVSCSSTRMSTATFLAFDRNDSSSSIAANSAGSSSQRDISDTAYCANTRRSFAREGIIIFTFFFSLVFSAICITRDENSDKSVFKLMSSPASSSSSLTGSSSVLLRTCIRSYSALALLSSDHIACMIASLFSKKYFEKGLASDDSILTASIWIPRSERPPSCAVCCIAATARPTHSSSTG
mmetsp:Transcript_42117/g.108415  ORF Transcript_42117/g.108415 Transcript_42117/m.108415 type:complete len:220 (-) Transcript_42117:1255-1914(-)